MYFMTEGFIPAHGGYETLLSYQQAKVVYDGMARFCESLQEKRKRMLRTRLRQTQQEI